MKERTLLKIALWGFVFYMVVGFPMCFVIPYLMIRSL